VESAFFNNITVAELSDPPAESNTTPDNLPIFCALSNPENKKLRVKEKRNDFNLVDI
jgi:hypothetical protein